MKHFYFLSHKKNSRQSWFSWIFNSFQFSGKIRCLMVMLGCFFTGSFFSQTNQAVPFNESLWNGYADKMQLSPKERLEFMSAHKKIHSDNEAAASQPAQQAQQAAKGIGDPNSVLAGPCVNADFELGNISGWTNTWGYNPGFTLTPVCCPTPGGQQTIVSGAANDPYGPFPIVCPGGTYSLRLGNSATGGQADRIEQTFMVSPSNANFSYKYAVVFQDPNHTAAQQPYFEISLFDASGVTVPCTFYHVAAGGGIPGFFNSTVPGSTDVIYKPWSTVLVDLTPYIGQNITIRFATYDCSLGGHFGYAYIDGVCQSFNSGESATVCAGASTTFCAPSGVATYTWNGPGLTNFTGQCAAASAPGTYTVSTTLFTGCSGPVFTYTLLNQAPPVANAGANATVCANNNTVSPGGSITGFTSTPQWSSSGSGAFTSTTNLNPTYTPSALDIAAGLVTLTLKTAGNGVCPVSTSTMAIVITPSPLVNAGPGGSTCNSDPFALSGSVTAGASTGTWSSSGDGTFAPSISALNASYTPGPGDITAGAVTLTLTSTNNGNCFPASGTLIIVVRQPPTSDAGANQALCSTTPTIALSGTIGGGSSTGAWTSSGTGAFTPTAAVLTKVYAITPADITAGSVIFTLTSTNNGPCAAATDTVKMVITRPATVTAGPNQFLCSTSGSINLTGSVTGLQNTGIWTVNGTGAFNPGPTAMNTNYSLTPADITAGSIIFTLTSTGNGPCAAVNDTVKMRIREPATANAGVNQALCSNAGTAGLAGTIGGGGIAGSWAASGIGAFAPSNTLLTTSYAITAADINTGSLTFTLTSTGNGPCAAVQDTVMMAIVKIATITAGPGQTVCSTGSINLAGTINSPSNTIAWFANGTGIFAPSGSVITPTYNLTAADITAGSVIFTVSSTNNGPCPVVSSSVAVAVKKLAIINAGINQRICSNSPTLNLSGTIGGGATTTTWASSGAGGFQPNTTNLNTAYGATTNDINAGTVIFTLTSTNNGPCPAVSDTVMMAIVKIATITAGPGQTVCSTASINLAGTINSPSNTIAWFASGTGVFAPSGSVITPTYNLTAADITAGSVIFTVSSTNNGPCPVVSSSVAVAVKKLAIINAGINQRICSNSPTLNLSGTIGGGATTTTWASSGAGGFQPNTTNLNTAYGATTNDINAGTVIFTLTSTNNGPCPAVSDTVMMAITKIATLTAGPNLYVCSNAATLNLAGVVTSPSNTATWASNGSGSFVPGANAAATNYSFSAADVTAGTVTFTLSSTNNGVCPAVNDTVKMRIMRLAAVNAGTNQALCSNTGNVALSGTVTGASGTAAWAANGTGAFAPGNTSLNTSYGITPADIGNNQVTFTLSSTGNGPCPVVSSTVGLAISNIATVSAGPNQFVCSSQNTIALSGTVTGVTSSGQWGASGPGNFVPGNTALAGSYSITPADITNGVVVFTLSSTNNGVCPAVNDTVKMRIMTLASVNAGTNQALCSNISAMALNGTVGGASGTAIWSTNGTGAFTPGNTSLNTSYSITPADIGNNQVTFTLSSTGNGPCPVVSSTVGLAISNIATVSAGPNQFVCSSQNSITLNGSVAGVTSSGQWGTAGAGSFLHGSTMLGGSYSITPADITIGTIIFTLTSTGNGVCPAVSDTVKMKIMRLATVNAGINQALCSNTGTISLHGAVSGAANAGAWTVNGTGAFVPGNASLNTSYSITPADISSGQVIFTLSSTGNGPCPVISDTVKMTIRTIATVSAGINQFICSAQNTIAVNGAISGGTASGQWGASGTGSFSPVNTNLAGTYALTTADINNGTVVFTLTSTGNGVCPAVRDTVKMKIMKEPVVAAGQPQFICSSQGTVVLSGTMTGGGNSRIWTNSGSGVFTPNAGVVNPSYIISPQDISAGSVVFTLTSQNSAPCPEKTSTTSVMITTPAQVAAGPSQTLCSTGSSISLAGSVSGGMGAVSWLTSGSGAFNPGHTLPVTGYVLTPSDIASGLVSFTLISTSNGNCPQTRSGMTVLIKELARVNAGADKSICSTQSLVPLQGVITGATNTGTWTSSGTGTCSPNQPAGSYNTSAADISQGTVTLVLTSSNNDVCPAVTDTMKLTIVTRPLVTVSRDTTVCEKNSMIALSASVTGGSGTPQWATSGSGNFLPVNTLAATHYSLSSSDKAVGQVSLSFGFPASGPCGYTGSGMQVHILPGPHAAFIASAYTVELPGDAVQFINSTASAHTYTWSFGDGQSSTATDPSHNYAAVGFYHTTLIARNDNGCMDTTEKLVTVITGIKFPTAFTPNTQGGSGGYYDKNDNSNDVFFPYTLGVEEYDLTVFNRWGELIFKSTDVNIGWDGYFNGKLCQQDVYVYKLNLVFFDGRKYNKTGSITLLR